MVGIVNFETFLLAAILLNLTPGNDTIFILSRTIAQGRQAGFVSVLGIATGSLIHTLLAGLGLSLVIAKSIIAFTIIKFTGAVYLVYIGYKMLRDPSQLNTELLIAGKKINLEKIYRDAVFTNVLNPKVALFFIAFLPQFIDPVFKHTIIPFLVLGTVFTITGTIWCLVISSFAAAISGKLKKDTKISWFINKTCGIVMIVLGIKLALTARK